MTLHAQQTPPKALQPPADGGYSVTGGLRRRDNNKTRGLCEQWFPQHGYNGGSALERAKKLKEQGRPLFRCGKCGPCRQVRSDNWLGRALAEGRTATQTLLLTLTYASKGTAYGHVNARRAKTLAYEDMQNFFKRMRKRGYEFSYFVAGEYGGRKGRAHWHVLLFLRGAKTFEWHVSGDGKGNVWPVGTPLSERYPQRYQDIWMHGNFTAKPAGDRQAVEYVTKYIRKEIDNDLECKFGCSQRLGYEYLFRDWMDAVFRVGACPKYGTYSLGERSHNGYKSWLYRMSPYLSAKFANAFVEEWDRRCPDKKLVASDWLLSALARYDKLFGSGLEIQPIVNPEGCRAAVKPEPPAEVFAKATDHISHQPALMWSETTQTWYYDCPDTLDRCHYTIGPDLEYDFYPKVHSYHQRRLQFQADEAAWKKSQCVLTGTEQRLVQEDLPLTSLPEQLHREPPPAPAFGTPIGDMPREKHFANQEHENRARRAAIRRSRKTMPPAEVDAMLNNIFINHQENFDDATQTTEPATD